MKDYKFNNSIIVFILILGFNQGLLEGFNIMDVSISSIILDATIILFSLLNFNKKSSYRSYSIIALILLCVTLLSFLFMDLKIIPFILFLRELFIPLLFFITVLKIRGLKYNLLKQVIIILFVEQIIATIFKLFFLGVAESVIGTMSPKSGGIATLFSLISTSLFFLLYLLTRKKIFIMTLPLFLIISIASVKLATLFYLPMVLVYCYYLWFKSMHKGTILSAHFIQKLSLYFVVSIFLLYLMVRLTPRANYEHKVWGSFDINFISNFTDQYVNRDRIVQGVQYSGRLSAINLYMAGFSERPIENILFGKGPGIIVKSSLLEDSYTSFQRQFGYGAKLGFIWVLEQIGLIGLIVFIVFFLSIFKNLNKKNIPNPLLAIYSKSLILIFALDFFTYSSVFLISAPLTSYFYLIIGVTLNTTKSKKSFYQKPKKNNGVAKHSY